MPFVWHTGWRKPSQRPEGNVSGGEGRSPRRYCRRIDRELLRNVACRRGAEQRQYARSRSAGSPGDETTGRSDPLPHDSVPDSAFRSSGEGLAILLAKFRHREAARAPYSTRGANSTRESFHLARNEDFMQSMMFDALPHRVGSRYPSPGGTRMRRMLLEVPRDELARFKELPNLVCESFRVVHQFQLDEKRFAGICEVKCRDRECDPTCLVGRGGITKAEELSQADNGTYLAYFEGKPNADWAGLMSSTGGHVYPPFELTPKTWRINLMGTSRQLERFMSRLRSHHYHFHVRAVGNADFRVNSPLSGLTPKQRVVLSTAHRLGYYGVPRRADSARVARTVRLSKATTVEHLRKAEKRLMDDLLAQ